MKDIYEAPKSSVIEFDVKDVIVTSGCDPETPVTPDEPMG